MFIIWSFLSQFLFIFLPAFKNHFSIGWYPRIVRYERAGPPSEGSF